MKAWKQSILLFFALTLAGIPLANAKGSIGLITGLAFPSSASASFAYGLRLDYEFSSPFSAALAYIGYSASASVTADGNSVLTENASTLYSLDINFEFSGSLKDFFIGARTGWMVVSQSATVTTSTTSLSLSPGLSKIFLGPRLAYDHELNSSFSFGLEIAYLFGFGGDAPNALLVLPITKFRF